MQNTEILRLISGIIAAAITILTGVGLAIDPGLAAQATEIVTAALTLIVSVVALLEWARKNVWSRQSAAELAEAILTANKTGTVPYEGVKAAQQVEGAAATFIPPALTAALVAFGFPAGFAAQVGPEAAKIALEAARKAARRPATDAEMDSKALEGL